MTTAAVGSALADLLAAFAPITLGHLGRAALLDRVDTKYLVPVALVPGLVARCTEAYRALEVEGERMFSYQTRYFDTPARTFFREHVTGRLPRRKVRIRSYGGGTTHSLELKRKTPGGRTLKVRQPVGSSSLAELAILRDPAFRAHGVLPVDQLEPVLDVTYTRLTLVDPAMGERVTIDLDLAYRSAGVALAFPHVAIVEVKQPRRGRTPITELLREDRLRPVRCSKYCAGVAALCASRPVPTYRRVLEQLHSPRHAHVPRA